MLPGFAAEASLYRSTRSYQFPRGRARVPRGIVPAYLDTGCFEGCYANCNLECFELTGSARGSCLRGCMRHAEECYSECTFPGDPPPGVPQPPETGFLMDVVLRIQQCSQCCTEGANSWFEQNILAPLCMKACLIVGCNR
jgi:hypothetical protein